MESKPKTFKGLTTIMIGSYPLQSEEMWRLKFNQITLRDGRGKWEESQWNRRHLSMDESLETPLAEATISLVTEIDHLTEGEFHNSHYKHITNTISDERSA